MRHRLHRKHRKLIRRRIVERGVLLLGVETGAFLVDVGEVAVTDNLGIGIVALQVLQEEPESRLLLRGASVGNVEEP